MGYMLVLFSLCLFEICALTNRIPGIGEQLNDNLLDCEDLNTIILLLTNTIVRIAFRSQKEQIQTTTTLTMKMIVAPTRIGYMRLPSVIC